MLDVSRQRTYSRRLAAAILVLLALGPASAAAGPLMTGAGAGAGSHVRVFDLTLPAEIASFFAFDPPFTGGVTVALGDVNGDGVLDLITGAGPSGGPHVKVFDGLTGALLLNFFAYVPEFRGGVFVAAGDVNGDGRADIITGAGPSGGPHVKVFDGLTGALLLSFFAYVPEFRGGVFVAAGDVNGDGRVDIVTGAGPGGGPHVRIFDGMTGADLGGFFAYAPTFPGGVYVAVGDANGDGRADIVTGAGPGGGPHVRILDGMTGADLGGFFAYGPPFFDGGVRVAAGDINDDGRVDIVTGAGPGGGPHVKVFDGPSLADLGGMFVYDALFTGGVFVAADAGTNIIGSTPTTTVLNLSPNPSVFGQPVTFTATVTSTAGFPIGRVAFRDGPTVLGIVLLTAGQATHLELDLTTGPHSITAEYLGNPTFAPSTGGPLIQTVAKAATSIVVESSANPSVFGQAVTFTATVSATPPGSGEPTGAVVFFVDGVPQGAIGLSGTQALFSTSALAAGNHTISAQYGGDGNFQASTSSDLVQDVDPAATSTALASSVNPSGIGQPVTFTATVTAIPPVAGTPVGNVQFLDGATPLGPAVPLDGGGQAQFTTSSLAAGPHSITAVYLPGNANFLGSTSPAVDQQVVQVAVDDSFDATGNIAIVVAAPGVLANDSLSPLVTLVQGAAPGSPVATTAGGTVTLNADGSFTYDPPTGMTGIDDTFTYQATTGGGAASTATVTINLADILWFVCDGCASGNLGTLLNPYTSVGQFSTNNTGAAGKPQDGQKVYIRSGTYDGPTDTLTLRNGQQSWGQGIAAAGVLVPAPNTHPDFAALTAGARPEIRPASGNGINVAMGNAIRDLDVGNVAPGMAKIVGLGFGILTIERVILTGIGGALDLTSGTLAATLDSIESIGSAATGITLTGTAGSLTVSSGTAITGSGGTGVSLVDNASIITFADLLVTPAGGQRGLHATGNSALLTVASGTIATSLGTAVEITHPGGPGGPTPLALTLTNVTATGGPNGIVLQNTSGSFAANGGSIVNTTGGDGAVQGNGVYLSGVTSVTLANMTISDHQNHAIRGIDVTGFTLANSTISGVNGNALDEGSVRFEGLVGAASITGTLIDGGVQDNVRVFNTSGALNPLTISGGTIGLNDATNGNDGVLVLAEGDATVVVNVTGVTFTGAKGDLFLANALGTATLNVTLQDNIFQNTMPTSVGGGVTIRGGDATSNINVTYNVSGTITPQTFQGARGSALTVDLVNGAGTATGTIQNNAIGVAAVEGSGSTDGSGISVSAAGTFAHTVTIDTNTVLGIGTGMGGSNGIEVIANEASAVSATLTGNIIGEFAGGAFAGIYLLAGGDVGHTATMCADIRDNIVDASGSTGAFDLFGDQVAGALSTYSFPGTTELTGGPGLDAFLAAQNFFNGNGADTSAITTVTPAVACGS